MTHATLDQMQAALERHRVRWRGRFCYELSLWDRAETPAVRKKLQRWYTFRSHQIRYDIRLEFKRIAADRRAARKRKANGRKQHRRAHVASTQHTS